MPSHSPRLNGPRAVFREPRAGPGVRAAANTMVSKALTHSLTNPSFIILI